uniref:Retrotransposon protein, putative, unclassified n=1 Tax=Oryza sativa subsp. japonica TaxID=39947 RepID=Q2QXA3_ORYSJ|nr:retrotransposon protein, putative, unclassified [Oryza sativa Japonica Group]
MAKTMQRRRQRMKPHGEDRASWAKVEGRTPKEDDFAISRPAPGRPKGPSQPLRPVGHWASDRQFGPLEAHAPQLHFIISTTACTDRGDLRAKPLRANATQEGREGEGCEAKGERSRRGDGRRRGSRSFGAHHRSRGGTVGFGTCTATATFGSCRFVGAGAEHGRHGEGSCGSKGAPDQGGDPFDKPAAGAPSCFVTVGNGFDCARRYASQPQPRNTSRSRHGGHAPKHDPTPRHASPDARIAAGVGGSAGRCPSTPRPNVTSNGERGLGFAGTASSFPSATQLTPQHLKYKPFGPTGGEHKSRCTQLADVEPAWSGGFALESRTAVRLQQRCSSTNHSTTGTDTRLRNKSGAEPGRYGLDPAFVRSIHGGTPGIAVWGRTAEHCGATTHASHDFALRHAISTDKQAFAARCHGKSGGEKGLPLSGGIKIHPIPTQFKFPPVPRDENTKAKVIHLALDGIARSWYFNLPANSIYSWEQLRDVFVLNFRGTYEEPKTQQHLLGIRQSPGESIREYMRRFSQARCQVQDITEASIINAASAGLLEGELTRKIANKEPQTLEHLLRIIDGYARGEEDSKRWQAIQAEYDKASIATAQAQVQAQVAEPTPLTVRQPQLANQGQPPRPSQAPMTWRKFRNDRTGKAVMAVKEVQALRKEFDAQQAGSHQ